MDELHRAADKLCRELDVMEAMSPAPGTTQTREQIELILAQGKRVRAASTFLIKVAARRRDKLQPQEGTS